MRGIPVRVPTFSRAEEKTPGEAANRQPLNKGVLEAIKLTQANFQGFDDLAARSKNLASLLSSAQELVLHPDDTLRDDLGKIQKAIDILAQAVKDEHARQSDNPGSTRQPVEIGWKAQSCNREIDQAQHALDKLIASSVSRLSGSALKDFMKGIYPDPDQLLSHGDRILPALQQRDLVRSKGVQRLAGAPKHPIINHLSEGSRLVFGGQARIEASPAQQAKSLGWVATRSTSKSHQKAAVNKLGDAYQKLWQSGTNEEIVAALHPLVSGLGNLPSIHLRREAQKVLSLAPPARLASALVAGLSTVKTDVARQDEMLHILHLVSVMQQQEKITFSPEQKFDIASALASLYTEQIERSPAFAEMRSRFVDDEVREYATARLPALKDVVPFSVERDVLDLSGNKPVDEGDGALKQSSTRKGHKMDIDGMPNWAKEIAHGPRSAMTEKGTLEFLGMAGVAVPKTRIARYEDVPMVIASQFIPGFKDLGRIMLDLDALRPVLEKDWGENKLDELEITLERVRKLSKELDELNEKQPVDSDRNDPITTRKREIITERYEIKQEIYKMMPVKMRKNMEKQIVEAERTLQQKIGTMQFLAQWVADVDFLNFEWFNAGLSGNGEPVALDKANALDQGFGGGQKDAGNVKRANEPARLTDPRRPNQMVDGSKYPELMRRYPKARDHAFDADPGLSPTNVGRHARSRPIATANPEAIRASTRNAEYGGPWENMIGVPDFEAHALAGQMEGAFHLSLLTEDAIRRLAIRVWPQPDDEKVPYKPGSTIRRTPEELANILIERREKMLSIFKPEDMERWKQLHPSRVKAVYNQVAAAMADKVEIHIDALPPAVIAAQGESRKMRPAQGEPRMPGERIRRNSI